MKEMPLLDLLWLESGCVCLSDLHFLSPWQKKRLANKVKHLSAKDEDLDEWNDALTYLSNALPEETAQAAKARLIRLLYDGGSQ